MEKLVKNCEMYWKFIRELRSNELVQYGFIENVNPNAEFIQGSINNIQLINNLFEEHKFEFVFHLSAYAAEGLSHFIISIQIVDLFLDRK